MIRNFYGVADVHMEKLFGRIHRYQRKSGNTGTFPWTSTSRKLFVLQIENFQNVKFPYVSDCFSECVANIGDFDILKIGKFAEG